MSAFYWTPGSAGVEDKTNVIAIVNVALKKIPKVHFFPNGLSKYYIFVRYSRGKVSRIDY